MTTTPVDELRQAAETLRRAAASAHRASPSPWTVDDDHVVRCADGMIVADRSSTDHPAERADLPYIVRMHPGASLALADWLDETARFASLYADLTIATGAPPAAEEYDTFTRHALAVARQLLGATSKQHGLGPADGQQKMRLLDELRAGLTPIPETPRRTWPTHSPRPRR